jgi:hypothetical protein
MVHYGLIYMRAPVSSLLSYTVQTYEAGLFALLSIPVIGAELIDRGARDYQRDAANVSEKSDDRGSVEVACQPTMDLVGSGPQHQPPDPRQLSSRKGMALLLALAIGQPPPLLRRKKEVRRLKSARPVPLT